MITKVVCLHIISITLTKLFFLFSCFLIYLSLEMFGGDDDDDDASVRMASNYRSKSSRSLFVLHVELLFNETSMKKPIIKLWLSYESH